MVHLLMVLSFDFFRGKFYNYISYTRGGIKVELDTQNVYDKAVVNRIKRLQGQINGALKMIEEGQDCKEVVTQLSAAKNALNRTMNVIVSDNLVQCVQNHMLNNSEENTEDLVKEAVELLNKSR